VGTCRTRRAHHSHSSFSSPAAWVRLPGASFQMRMYYYNDNDPKRKIINVASVPQRSPFRYPGGKTWLVPFARAWLHSLPRKPRLFVEPFAGGGSIALTVAFESLADRVVMVELDKDVAAVWETLFNGQGKWLAARIMDFDVSVESAKEELATIPSSARQRAFQTILKNRVYYGGIMAHGSAMIRHGENGKGIKSRWYPTTLKRHRCTYQRGIH
jgi:DNA adenine methylase